MKKKYLTCNLVINHHLLRRKNFLVATMKKQKKMFRIHWSNLQTPCSKIQKKIAPSKIENLVDFSKCFNEIVIRPKRP